jgi:hypothetical protein
MSTAPLPLEGVRIVDFTAYLSPPFNATDRNKLGLTLDLARPDGVYPLGTRCKTCKTEP